MFHDFLTATLMLQGVSGRKKKKMSYDSYVSDK